MLSIVIPAYNEGEVILNTAQIIQNIMKESDIVYEIIFVDDGSCDNTWEYIEEIADKNTSIIGVKLSKNFGKESAMLAGLAHAKGDACAVIDCDLQHPPKLLVEMYQIWKIGGMDIVECVKQSRGKESAVYKHLANLFYILIERMGGIDLKDSSDFQLLDRRVVDIIVNMPERQRFFRALSSWIGFRRKQIPFCVEPRQGGTSKFNFYQSAKYALENITSFSSAPMQLVTFIGVSFSIAAAILSIHTLYIWFVQGAVEGFTTVILLLLIIGSMLMISLGIIGFYIGKIYEEIKCRPSYLIERIVSKD